MTLRGEYIIRNKIKRSRKPATEWPARMGDGNGTSKVPGYPTLRYVRVFGSEIPIIVERGPAPISENYPVRIGRGWRGTAILGTLNLDAIDDPEAEGVEPHADSHGPDGSDRIMVHLTQILPLLAYVSGNLEVTINPGYFTNEDGEVVRVEKTAVNMASHVPVSGAAWNLIRSSNTGVLSVVKGTPVTDISDLTLANDAPDIGIHYRVVAYVRQYAGQTKLSNSYSAPDMMPAAFLPSLYDKLLVEGEYGVPSIPTHTLKFPAGSITNNGGGSISIDLGVEAGDNTHTAAYASRPAASSAGDLFFPSDGATIERDTGAAWVPWGPIYPFTKPVSGDFSWINQGGATIDAAYGQIYLSTPANAATSLSILKKAAPATPYIITVALFPYTVIANFQNVGICWRQSSDGKLVTAGMGYSASNILVDKWTNATTYSANYASIATTKFPPMFLRIEDDGANRKCYRSHDGRHFMLIHSVGRTDFMTADEVGFYVNPQNASYGAGLLLLSWKEE